MYTWIYVTVIVLVFVGLVSFFALKNKKEKKRLDEFKNSRKSEIEKSLKEIELPQAEQKELKDIPKTAEKEAVFEKFSLDKKEEQKKTIEKNIFPQRKPVSLDGKDETKDAFGFDDEDDKFFDDKFGAYEKFLKDRLKLEEEKLEDMEDIDALTNFDFESLKDKNDDEIADMFKDLPPKAQETLINDILAKKEFDDDNEQ